MNLAAPAGSRPRFVQAPPPSKGARPRRPRRTPRSERSRCPRGRHEWLPAPVHRGHPTARITPSICRRLQVSRSRQHCGRRQKVRSKKLDAGDATFTSDERKVMRIAYSRIPRSRDAAPSFSRSLSLFEELLTSHSRTSTLSHSRPTLLSLLCNLRRNRNRTAARRHQRDTPPSAEPLLALLPLLEPRGLKKECQTWPECADV